MTRSLNLLINDENGFVISAELVLVASILILSMVVGLSEVSWNVNNELHDIAGGFDAANTGLGEATEHQPQEDLVSDMPCDAAGG